MTDPHNKKSSSSGPGQHHSELISMYDSQTWPETRRSETFHSQASKLWEFVTEEMVSSCSNLCNRLTNFLVSIPNPLRASLTYPVLCKNLWLRFLAEPAQSRFLGFQCSLLAPNALPCEPKCCFADHLFICCMATYRSGPYSAYTSTKQQQARCSTRCSSGIAFSATYTTA